MNKEISDRELVQVIGDFLEAGHVENIAAMFKQDHTHYRLSGELLHDERFMVRLGLAVLFEELAVNQPKELRLAIPYLLPLLQEELPHLRGEAANLLGIIGTEEVRAPLKALLRDPDPQVAEIARDALEGMGA